MHPEILSEEVFHDFILSGLSQDIYTSISEDDTSFSEHSSNSDDVNIRPTKRQKP